MLTVIFCSISILFGTDEFPGPCKVFESLQIGFNLVLQAAVIILVDYRGLLLGKNVDGLH